MKKNVRGLAFFVLILCVMSVVWLYIERQTPVEEINYSDLVMAVKNGEISRMEITDTRAKATYKEEKRQVVYDIPSKELFYAQVADEMDEQIANGTLTVIYAEESSIYAWISLLSPFFIIIVIAVVWSMMM